jgi:hypothetical protein
LDVGDEGVVATPQVDDDVFAFSIVLMF